jgi:hypothetical protein
MALFADHFENPLEMLSPRHRRLAEAQISIEKRSEVQSFLLELPTKPKV